MAITQDDVDDVATKIMGYVKVGSDWYKGDVLVSSVEDYQPHEDDDLASELGAMFNGNHAMNSCGGGKMAVVIGRNWQKKHYACDADPKVALMEAICSSLHH